MSASIPSNGKASHDESDVYDRQIRLWGAEAQNKIRDTKVLYVHMSGVSSEILKNLVLAGVRAAICDGRSYPDAMSETPSSFLPPQERVKLSLLNAAVDAVNVAVDVVADDSPIVKEAGNAKKRVKTMTVAEAMPQERVKLSLLNAAVDAVDAAVDAVDDDDSPIVKEAGNAKKRVKTMTVAEAMQPHVLELNPLLDTCQIDETNRPLSSIPDSYFQQFDIVIASRLSSSVNNNDNDNNSNNNTMSQKDILRMAEATTKADGKFMLVDTFGMYGCAMIDLGPKHQFRQEKGKDKLSDLKAIQPYVPFSQMMAAGNQLHQITDRWHKNGPPKVLVMYFAILHYRNIIITNHQDQQNSQHFSKITQQYLKHSGLDTQYLGDEKQLDYLYTISNAQVSPVCAVLGGVLGNEVIKAISGKGQPANNVLLFDGMDGG
eukprot:CAMPEP_0197840898 /NCGR_PEP_ID=MMETSP1437-20131217/45870_1 /TAXON_ID=49252 ORGANISM="Eucampia antarctica, Strain CCMP1452" /NCGR_SAMPLE_ID=MMETSP1437 /ASSEMBLY_ACC=CAM_ASM_001096 /LENGTH=431 /DNA_ID=CAMNT_0043450575 /DNA_START=63 /DNA_END=1354 /DNA_ORIENTATION=+